jgi:pimeloyl-ACP methyl ester carboxylesterase
MIYTILSLSVIYIIIMLIIGRQLAFNDVLSRPKPNKRKLKDFDIQDIEFFGKDNVLLKGWFIKGKENSDGRTMIILHGWSRSRINLIEYIKLFSNNGFHVFAYDQRSHGNSGNGLVTYGNEEGTDLVLATEYLINNLDVVNSKKIGVLAFSLGTGAAIYAATLSKNFKFKFIVLEGVFYKSFDVGGKLLNNIFGSIIGRIIGYLFFTVGVQIWSLGKFRHSEAGKKIKEIFDIPILIIRGDNDKMVPAESANRFISNMNSNCEIWFHSKGLPEDDLGHVNSIRLYPDEYKFKVLSFIRKNI